VALGALVSLGLAIWLLVVALAESPGGTPLLVFSLVADAVSFSLLGLALSRAKSRQ
jgi:hypothetical protein